MLFGTHHLNTLTNDHFNPSTSDEELKQYLTLGSCLAGGSLVGFAILSFFMLGLSATLPSLLGVLGYAMVILLQNKGSYEAAKRVLLFTSNVAAFFNCLVYSTESDYSYYMIFCGFAPYLFLNKLEYRERFCWTCLSFVLFVIAYPLDEVLWPAPSPEIISVLGWIFRLSIFFTALFWVRRLFDLKSSYIEALRRNKELLNKVETLSKVGGFEIDAAMRSIQPSSSILDIFGVDFRDKRMSMRLIEKLVHPEDRASISQIFQTWSALALPYIHEFRALRADGKMIHVRTYLDAERDSDGQIVRYIGAVQDISREKESDKLIREQQVQIASSAKFFALASMAAGLVHEIVSPLAIITGKLKQIDIKLRRLDSQSDGIEDDAKVVQESASRMARIVSGLLGFARNAEYDKKQFLTVAELLEYSLEFCRERMRIQKIELKLEMAQEDLLVHCRSVQIVQVFINLIDNACDAMNGLPASQPRWIIVQAKPSVKEGYIQMTFSNSGPRIPESIRSKIMEPFFTSKDEGKGPGLGLSISRGIIEQHGGEFYLDPESYHTTFVLELPTAAAAL